MEITNFIWPQFIWFYIGKDLRLRKYQQQLLEWFKFMLIILFLLWKVRLCSNKITINYLLSLFLLLFIHPCKTKFLAFLYFLLMMSILNILRAVKRWKLKYSKTLYLKTIKDELHLPNCYSIKHRNKKHLIFLATKLIKNISC